MADVETTHPPMATSDAIIDDGEEAESKEIMLMKQRVEEMEREAKKLRELQAAAEQASAASGGENGDPLLEGEDKAMADNRSVYVGNVDYGATPEEIQGHFQACGTINRVTILCDKFTGHPKGYAYVEFAEPEHIDAALAMDNSLFRGRLIKHSPRAAMLQNLWRLSARLMSTATAYPFSKSALMPPAPVIRKPKALKAGRGLMEHLRQTLPAPEKQKMIHALFSRRSPNHLQPGSVITVTSEHAPTTFTGVLLAIRRRGPDTSFTVRNIIQRTGVEMQFFVASPHLKDIKLVKKPPKGRMRRAKLYYLRDSPEKMSAIASSR
ncbi:translation protein SH3-like domain-containing protein [Amanita rubescens]|nr:translation protein SH3-like domain-containing protein [Amanita rubescens]KAF8351111.1 translation protein SH3-like domain-containing protein [Amanita rubescens]